MEFRDLLKKDIDKNKIVLGSRQGGLLTIDIDESPSIIITGETGSGKSIMLNQIILQMINKNISEDLRLILIDTAGVELNVFKDTSYCLLSAMNDLDKSQEVLAKINEEITRRKQLLFDNDVSNIDELNEFYDHHIPRLLIAIDDNKALLQGEDVDNMFKNIIDDLKGLNILLVLSTNDTNNKFFIDDNNLLSKVLISFDTASEEEAQNSDIPFSNELLTGRFIVYRDGNYEEYHNLDFDDNIIKEIID